MAYYGKWMFFVPILASKQSLNTTNQLAELAPKEMPKMVFRMV